MIRVRRLGALGVVLVGVLFLVLAAAPGESQTPRKGGVLRVGMIGEPHVAPVAEHAGMDEILVDRGELGRKNFLEDLEDLGITLHAHLRTVKRSMNGIL